MRTSASASADASTMRPCEPRMRSKVGFEQDRRLARSNPTRPANPTNRHVRVPRYRRHFVRPSGQSSQAGAALDAVPGGFAVLKFSTQPSPETFTHPDHSRGAIANRPGNCFDQPPMRVRGGGCLRGPCPKSSCRRTRPRRGQLLDAGGKIRQGLPPACSGLALSHNRMGWGERAPGAGRPEPNRCPSRPARWRKP